MSIQRAFRVTPLSICISAGLGLLVTPAIGQSWSYSKNYVSGQIEIDTYYLSTVKVADSVTAASGSGCAYGSCVSDPGCENESDTDTTITPESAAVNASKTLYRCPGGGTCFVAHGKFAASLGLESSTHSRININYSRGDSSWKSDCDSSCSSSTGTGVMNGSWAAAWPLNAPGGIDSIDVVLKNHSSNWSSSDDCTPRSGGVDVDADPVHTSSFNRITATYYDEYDQVVGTESYQGVVFVDHYPDGSGTNSQSYFGDLYDDANEIGGTPSGEIFYPAPACAYPNSCSWSSSNKDFEFSFTPSVGTVYVGYDGETTTLVGDALDVNEDGDVDYFDRVDIALSVGSTVNDAEYQPHADLDRDGDVDQDDIDILDTHPCLADIDGDGVVDTDDSDQFVDWHNASNPNADLTGDGVFNFFDVADFLTIYGSGC
tara:strand:+ start:682 stop:1971 length:1290 start_codon:yes stop_codon:yes gene_type:complete